MVEMRESRDREKNVEKTTIMDVGKGLLLLGVIILVIYAFLLPLSMIVPVTTGQKMFNMWKQKTLVYTLGVSLLLVAIGTILSLAGKKWESISRTNGRQ